MAILSNTALANPSRGYDLEQSLRFDHDSSARLTKTFASRGDAQKNTFSAWVKSAGLKDTRENIFSAALNDSNRQQLYIQNNTLRLFGRTANSNDLELYSNQLFRDPAAWYHVVVANDSTQATAANRVRVYVNGQEITSWSTSSRWAQNYQGWWGRGIEHSIGTDVDNNTYDNYMDGYLAEVHFVDGQQLTPASFGETDSSTNQWIPKEVTGMTYGTNGFYLPFSGTDSPTAITDSSSSTYTVTVSGSNTKKVRGDNLMGSGKSVVALASGSGNWKCPPGVTSVEVLVVAAGGGGGGLGGGGGAGGVVHHTSKSVTAGNNYAYSIGTGGSGNSYNGGVAGSGGNTTFDTMTAVGGGGGSGQSGAGGSGGSGGGGNGGYASAGGSGTQADSGGGTGYGNNGGAGYGGDYFGGGGGGASAAGGAGNSPTGKTGAGGNGKYFATFAEHGEGGYFAGGGAGGGGNSTATGLAGLGGGAGYGGDYFGGGGGGADAAGGAGNSPTGKTGAGGNGKYFATFAGHGEGGYFAGGGAGGGGTSTATGLAGLGGGGTGSCGTAGAGRGGSGTANTGGGGGGGSNSTGSGDAGGDGGSGVVLIAWSYDKGDTASINFDGANGDQLSVPDNSDWDFGTGDFTLEHWVRPKSIPSSGNTHTTLFGGTAWPPSSRLYYDDTGLPYVRVEGNAYAFTGYTFEPGAWYHMAASRQGTNLRCFINGVLVATHTDSTDIQNSGVYYVAKRGDTTADNANAYLSDIRISNNARYTATFTPNTTPFTSDANTKLLISADGFTGLGSDSSGNFNYFDPTNIDPTDIMKDTPSNNFCTLNPVGSFRNPDGGGTLSEGNLKLFTGTGTGAYTDSYGTFSFSSGKWYFEAVIVDKSAGMYFGITDPSVIGTANSVYPMNQVSTVAWNPTESSGFIRIDNSDTSYSANTSAGAILGIAIDMDNDTIRGSINGTDYANVDISGSAVGSGVRVPFFCAFGQSGADTGSQIINFGQDSSFAGQKTAQGNQDGNKKGDFYYAPPSGFLALCTDNLPDPAIALPEQYFNTLLYTANGAAGRSITGVGFAPDFVWAKERNAVAHHVLVDSVRGTSSGGRLSSNRTNAEDATGGVTIGSFDSDGFTVGSSAGYLNSSTTNYVAWNWKAGGAASSNGNGTITSSVSANSTVGFSIVSYTGQSAAGTVGHGLSQAPEMIILKNRDQGVFWAGYVEALGNTKSISLNDSGASYTEKTWNDTSPTSTVFSIGAQSETSSGRFNVAGEKFIGYCFHSVDGYSKVGSYTGNASTDGAFIYTGFRPAFLLIKRSSATEGWYLIDNKREGYNFKNDPLQAQDSVAEADTELLDITSNGFKTRTTDTAVNGSGTYIYLAFAESPFKTANAR